ncbi:MAG: PAS domain-containing protein, partial [Opitutales bacterium]
MAIGEVCLIAGGGASAWWAHGLIVASAGGVVTLWHLLYAPTDKSGAACEQDPKPGINSSWFLGLTDAAVYRFFPDGKCVFVNDSHARISGRPTADFEADPMLWGKLVHPDDRAANQAALDGYAEPPDSFEADYRLRHVDGSWRYLHVRMTAERDSGGTLQAYLCYDVDETAERQRRTLSRAYDRLLHCSFEDLPLPAVMLDAEGHITNANAAFGKVIGKQAQGLEEQDFSWHLSEASKPVFQKLLRGLVITRHPQSAGLIINAEMPVEVSLKATITYDTSGDTIFGVLLDRGTQTALQRRIDGLNSLIVVLKELNRLTEEDSTEAIAQKACTLLCQSPDIESAWVYVHETEWGGPFVVSEGLKGHHEELAAKVRSQGEAFGCLTKLVPGTTTSSWKSHAECHDCEKWGLAGDYSLAVALGTSEGDGGYLSVCVAGRPDEYQVYAAMFEELAQALARSLRRPAIRRHRL